MRILFFFFSQNLIIRKSYTNICKTNIVFVRRSNFFEKVRYRSKNKNRARQWGCVLKRKRKRCRDAIKEAEENGLRVQVAYLGKRV